MENAVCLELVFGKLKKLLLSNLWKVHKQAECYYDNEESFIVISNLDHYEAKLLSLEFSY